MELLGRLTSSLSSVLSTGLSGVPAWIINTAVGTFILGALINFAVLVWLIRLIRNTPTELPKFMQPYSGLDSRFIKCGDDQIHYLQTGQGPNLVLLHGIGASVFVWRYVVEELSKSFTVTVMDLPGFGKSSKRIDANYGLDAQHDRLLSFLNALDIKFTYLAGSSMGGTLALWAATKNPSRFPKIAALSPAIDSKLIPRRAAKLLARVPYLHKTLNPITMNLLMRGVFSKSEMIAKESIRAYLEPYLDEGISVRTFLNATQLLGDTRLPGCFDGFSHPVLLIYGGRDRLIFRRSVERLQKMMPQSRLVMHPAAGHHPMEDEPQWCADQLVKFFA